MATYCASWFLLIQRYCYWAPATKHRGVTFTNLQWGYSPSSPGSPSVTWGHCSFGAEPFSLLWIDLLLIGWYQRYFWASLALRNIKGIDFRGRWPPTDTASWFLLIQRYCYWAPATKHCGVTFINLQWGYSPSSPSSPSVTFTNLQCMLHQVQLLQVQLLQVHHSLISTVTSTSAPFTKSPLYNFYNGCTNLHSCVATVAPSCSESPFVSHYIVWLCYLTIKW